MPIVYDPVKLAERARQWRAASASASLPDSRERFAELAEKCERLVAASISTPVILESRDSDPRS
jgi:hypothetical protein